MKAFVIIATLFGLYAAMARFAPSTLVSFSAPTLICLGLGMAWLLSAKVNVK